MKPARFALLLSVLAALLLLAAGPGTRMELWEFRSGFALMRWAVFIGLAGAALALVMLLLPLMTAPAWNEIAVLSKGLSAGRPSTALVPRMKGAKIRRSRGS